jgi:predicted nucleic acid-binding protein
MKTFFDASAFAQRYIAEQGSSAVDDICQATDELALCVICVPEILSALNRRVREKVIRRADYGAVKLRLLKDVRDAEIINLTDDVVANAMLVLEENSVRAMDALHIAAAKAWKADLFVTADRDQARAAHRMGLKQVTI